MRGIAALAALATVAGLAAGVVLAPSGGAGAEEETPATAETIRQDLVLKAVLATPSEIEPGQPLHARLVVRNRSSERTHAIVAPGDGSESGWREPHVHWTVERRTAEGAWEPVPPRGIGRCGNYDAHWEKDVETLAPGAEIPFVDWVPSPRVGHDLHAAGRYRLTAHYAYRGAAAGKGPGTPRNDAGISAMRGAPAFSLTAEPIEVTVAHKFAIDVRATRSSRSRSSCP